MLQSQQWQEAKDLAKQVQIKLLIHYWECRSNSARASNNLFLFTLSVEIVLTATRHLSQHPVVNLTDVHIKLRDVRHLTSIIEKANMCFGHLQ